MISQNCIMAKSDRNTINVFGDFFIFLVGGESMRHSKGLGCPSILAISAFNSGDLTSEFNSKAVCASLFKISVAAPLSVINLNKRVVSCCSAYFTARCSTVLPSTSYRFKSGSQANK